MTLEFLRNYPEGRKLYTPICGTVTFVKYDSYSMLPIIVKSPTNRLAFTEEGKLHETGECLIFPSKNTRTWNPWRILIKEGDFVINENYTYYVGARTLNKYTLLDSKGNQFVTFGTTIIGWASEYQISVFKQTLITNNPDKYKEVCHTTEKLLHRESTLLENQLKFDPQSLKPYDKVLVRENDTDIWQATLFSHIDKPNFGDIYCCSGCHYNQCIPFNEETRSLLGTNLKQPEFYQYQ